MANNLIQIKRSLTTATPVTLNNGELAYTSNGDQLFIGSNGVVVPIAGKKTPGTLTANQALVANSTSAIDRIIVANAVVTTLTANGSVGTNGQVLVSNGTAVFWGTGTSGANTQIQFNDSGVANATAGFTFDKTSNNLTVSNTIFTTTVNAASYNAGAIGLGTGGSVQNTTSIFVGNNTVNTVITSGGMSVNGSATVANSSGVYTTTVNGSFITVGTSTIANSTGVYTGIVNGATIQVGSAFTANSTLVNAAAINITGQVNTATIYATTSANIASQIWANSSGLFVSNTTGTVNSAVISVGSNFIANSTKVTFTGANIDATSAFLKVADAVISGNLTVSGTVTTINTQQLVVNDNIIELGSNNTITDAVDSGFYAPAGNSTAVWYSGLVRVAALSTNTNPVYRIFVSNTNPNTAPTIEATANTRTGSLTAYLLPYGVGGGFVANSSNVQITANSTFGVNIVANTLTLTTALAGVYGGTGKLTVANNSLLYGNSTNGYNELTFNTTVGYVLQSNGTAIVYDLLDGGSF
jgi:hypothetical protein